MKHFTFLLALFFYTFSFSQIEKFEITGTRQDWAGGVCCSSGTNYSLKVTSTELDLSDFAIDSIYLDENVFYQNIQVSKGKNFIQINFGLYFNHNQKDFFIEEKIIQKPKKNNVLILCKGNQKFELKITELKELEYLAYP